MLVELPNFPPWFIYVVVGLFGACVGSFLNVCIYRMPMEISVVKPRSHCPRCSHPIPWYDNIPIFSYIILWGRCRQCKYRISPRYLMIEALTTALSVAVFFKFGEMIPYLVYFCFLIAPLIVITFIDLEHYIIPDAISIPGIIAGVMANLALHSADWSSTLIDSVLGILVGGGFLAIVALVYEWIKKQEGLGGGDVKLAAMLGAFFGWKAIIFILLVSSVLGSIIGLFLILIFKKTLKYAIPYGPFLALAACFYLFWGEFLLNWYLNLF